MGCGCADKTLEVFASEIGWDGNKLVCGSTVIKPCDTMDTVITKIFNMACDKGIVYYNTASLNGYGDPSTTPTAVTGFSYTVPAGVLNAEYLFEFFILVSITGPIIAPSGSVNVQPRKNGNAIDFNTHKSVVFNGAIGEQMVAPIAVKIKFTASTGDILAPYLVGSTGVEAVSNAVCIITKVT